MKSFTAVGVVALAAAVDAAAVLTPVPVVGTPAASITSTIFATHVYTVTACAETVTNCPARSISVVTEVIPVTTTVCPVTETEGEPVKTVTNVYTITSCPPEVTNCPVGSVITHSATEPVQTHPVETEPVETEPVETVIHTPIPPAQTPGTPVVSPTSTPGVANPTEPSTVPGVANPTEPAVPHSSVVVPPVEEPTTVVVPPVEEPTTAVPPVETPTEVPQSGSASTMGFSGLVAAAGAIAAFFL